MKKSEIQIPSVCPICNYKLTRVSVDLVCENMSCGAKTQGIITNMFNTLDIKGLSDKFAKKIVDKYNIDSIDKLMNLSIEELKNLPGFGVKSAQNAYDAIHSVKEVSPEQFFALLNIPNQGVRVFENLFSQFPMEKLLEETFKPEDILNTKGIAEKSANAIHEGIQSNLERMRENSKWFTIVKKKNDNNNESHKSNMVGKSFCITGTLNDGTRKEYESLITKVGGKISNVSKTLNYLVTNDTDTSSSKMKKTIDINNNFHNNSDDRRIIIITEEILRKMIGE